MVLTFFRAHLGNWYEFLLYLVQLLYGNQSLFKLFRIHFNFFRHVLRTRPRAEHTAVAAGPRHTSTPRFNVAVLLILFQAESVNSLKALSF